MKSGLLAPFLSPPPISTLPPQPHKLPLKTAPGALLSPSAPSPHLLIPQLGRQELSTQFLPQMSAPSLPNLRAEAFLWLWSPPGGLPGPSVSTMGFLSLSLILPVGALTRIKPLCVSG